MSATAQTLQRCEKAVAFLKQYVICHILLVGHTDKRATAAYNLALSKKRVLAVRDALVKAGIDAKRLRYDYYGKNKLLTESEDEGSHARNRRVEFVFSTR